MSEHTTTAPADSGQQAAPPPKPKRPKPKSMLMIGEQTNALFENARLAKERGEERKCHCDRMVYEAVELLEDLLK